MRLVGACFGFNLSILISNALENIFSLQKICYYSVKQVKISDYELTWASPYTQAVICQISSKLEVD
jgi:hypothetical protein